MNRPQDLADFHNPPLTEVVLGIQFDAPSGYQQIYAHEVWQLFRGQFPNVQEHQPVPPQFEIFGTTQGVQLNIGLISGAVHDRFWFLTDSGDQLLQFQNDRLLHNWRKVEAVGAPYPRFENMIVAFEKECSLLFDFFERSFGSVPTVNQCEISYLNAIPIGPAEKFEDWLKLVAFRDFQPDDFSMTWRRVTDDEDGNPQGRIIIEANVGFSSIGERAILLNLTARGKPSTVRVDSALEFLSKNREMIVRTFAEITTDSAHRRWERI